MRHAFVFSLVLVTCAAEAGRPLQADDAAVMDPHACELEGAHGDWRLDGGGQRQTSLQLGCGIGWGSEVALNAIRPRELALNGKTMLASTAWADGDAQLTLGWSLSHRHVETAWRRSSAGLTLIGSAPLTRDLTLHANFGHQRDELLQRRSTTWALAVEHGGFGEGGRWQPMAEVFGDDRGKPWANAALRVAVLPDRLFVDASYGRQFAGARARLKTAGFKLAF
ncbi:hypothetical protein ACS5PN_15040 [Roseateles sp. NT4]|uniref:hypothetical protein n=1 Tax=Roseateles sp. NT4 TaxID=3453715 RepID=UPI003EEA0AD7